MLVDGLDDFLPARTLVFEVTRSHIFPLVGQLGLIPLPVNEQELPIREEVLHGDYCILGYYIADSLVTVPVSIFGDSLGINGVILTTGKAHGVLYAGGIVHPQEDVQLLAGHGQGIDVPTCVLCADENFLQRCS